MFFNKALKEELRKYKARVAFWTEKYFEINDHMRELLLVNEDLAQDHELALAEIDSLRKELEEARKNDQRDPQTGRFMSVRDLPPKKE